MNSTASNDLLLRVNFPDKRFEKTIKKVLNKSGDIIRYDMLDLDELTVDQGEIEDLTGLETAVNLESLWILNNRIKNLAPLSELKQLNTLCITDNQIHDITPISGLKELADINLSNNQICDITPLEKLGKLVWVDLSYNRIKDLSPIKNLLSIHMLNFSNNEVTDISPFSGLSNLEFVDIQNNQITDLAPLCGLEKLEGIFLVGNPPMKLSLLGRLPRLTVLDVAAYRNSLSIRKEKRTRNIIWKLRKFGLQDRPAGLSALLPFLDPTLPETAAVEHIIQEIRQPNVKLQYITRLLCSEWLTGIGMEHIETYGSLKAKQYAMEYALGRHRIEPNEDGFFV